MNARIITTSRKKSTKPILKKAILGIFCLCLVGLVLVFVNRHKTTPTILCTTKTSPKNNPLVFENRDDAIDVCTNETSINEKNKDEKKRTLSIVLPNEFHPVSNVVKKVGRVVKAAGTGITLSTNATLSKVHLGTKTEAFLLKYALSGKHPSLIITRIDEGMAEDCLKALSKDIVIYDDDSEDVIEAKENVAYLKEELYKAMEDGYSAVEVLSEMRRVNNENVMRRTQMQRAYNDLVKTGTYEQAREYLDEANSILQSFSFPPLSSELTTQQKDATYE